MKILFLIPDDFPRSGACTSLLNNILSVGNIKDRFDETAVFSYCDKILGISQEIHDGVIVYRTGIESRMSLRQCKDLIFRYPLKTTKFILKKITGKLAGRVENFSVNMTIVGEIEQALYKLHVEQYDILVPLMGDPQIAAAAVKVQKRFPDIKLVIYQVDPFASNELADISTQDERVSFEQNIFSLADHIITTPILLQEAQTRYSDDICCKMSAMEFPNVVPRHTAAADDSAQSIRCVFAGNIYGNIRDPKYTLSLFRTLGDHIQLELIGEIPPEDQMLCKQYGIKVHGRKPLEETRKELEDASILVNIGNSMLNQVPSKLSEYISYGKPIINICKNRNCPSCDYLAKFPYALNLFEENDILEKQRDSLRLFISENSDKRVTPEVILETYRTCTPEYCSEQMLRIFENVLAQNG